MRQADALLIAQLRYRLSSGKARPVWPSMTIIDERRGRRIAQQVYGLLVKGAAGILVEAHRRRLIDEMRPRLLELRAAGPIARQGLSINPAVPQPVRGLPLPNSRGRSRQGSVDALRGQSCRIDAPKKHPRFAGPRLSAGRPCPHGGRSVHLAQWGICRSSQAGSMRPVSPPWLVAALAVRGRAWGRSRQQQCRRVARHGSKLIPHGGHGVPVVVNQQRLVPLHGE